MKVIVLDGHPRQEELADYVSDALSAAQSERLEEHLLDCPRCAARLQEAASFQLLLHEAAESLESDRRAPPSRLRRVGRRLGAVGGLWGAAAAFALVLMRPPTDDTEPVPVVTLADDPSPERSDDRRWSGECDPTDIGCAEALLATLDLVGGRFEASAVLDLLALPDFAFGAMENAGAVFFRDSILLLDAARVERDRPTRLGMYREASRIIVDDAPWGFTFSDLAMEMWQPYVHNYRPNPVWSNFFRDVWLDLPRRRVALWERAPTRSVPALTPFGGRP